VTCGVVELELVLELVVIGHKAKKYRRMKEEK
jgi:hypothetical protein